MASKITILEIGEFYTAKKKEWHVVASCSKLKKELSFTMNHQYQVKHKEQLVYNGIKAVDAMNAYNDIT